MSIITFPTLDVAATEERVENNVVRVYTQQEIDKSLSKEHRRTGFGCDITGCTTFQDILNETGTDWHVDKQPVYLGDGRQVPNNWAIIRDMDGKILSTQTVSDQFAPLQNDELSEIADGLISEGAKPYRGGSYHGGANIWYEFDLSDTNILGDPHKHSLIILNSHIGKGSVMIMDTLMRIVCSNQMNVAMKGTDRKWAIVHKGNMQLKMTEAQRAIMNANTYLEAYKATAEDLQRKSLTAGDVRALTEVLLPYGKDAKDTHISLVNERRARLTDLYYNKEDLKDFGSTAYRFLSAVADYTSHPVLKRHTKTSNEANEHRIMTGDPMLQNAFKHLIAA